jgi:hypothetical protein
LLGTHTSEIDELKKKKVDNDVFEAEINFLKSVINNASGSGTGVPLIPTGPTISPTDMSKIKEIIEKFPGVETDIEKIKNDLKILNLGTLKDHLKSLEDILNGKAD